jgi:hypothetical protein
VFRLVFGFQVFEFQVGKGFARVLGWFLSFRFLSFRLARDLHVFRLVFRVSGF